MCSEAASSDTVKAWSWGIGGIVIKKLRVPDKHPSYCMRVEYSARDGLGARMRHKMHAMRCHDRSDAAQMIGNAWRRARGGVKSTESPPSLLTRGRKHGEKRKNAHGPGRDEGRHGIQTAGMMTLQYCTLTLPDCRLYGTNDSASLPHSAVPCLRRRRERERAAVTESSKNPPPQSANRPNPFCQVDVIALLHWSAPSLVSSPDFVHRPHQNNNIHLNQAMILLCHASRLCVSSSLHGFICRTGIERSSYPTLIHPLTPPPLSASSASSVAFLLRAFCSVMISNNAHGTFAPSLSHHLTPLPDHFSPADFRRPLTTNSNRTAALVDLPFSPGPPPTTSSTLRLPLDRASHPPFHSIHLRPVGL